MSFLESYFYLRFLLSFTIFSNKELFAKSQATILTLDVFPFWAVWICSSFLCNCCQLPVDIWRTPAAPTGLQATKFRSLGENSHLGRLNLFPKLVWATFLWNVYWTWHSHHFFSNPSLSIFENILKRFAKKASTKIILAEAENISKHSFGLPAVRSACSQVSLGP